MRKAVLLGGVVLVALAAVSAYAVHVKRDEAARRRVTDTKLAVLVFLIENHDLGQTTVDLPPPRAVGDAKDPTGMRALHEYLMGGHYVVFSEADSNAGAFLRGDLDQDGWGRPIRYRCPGVVHRRGFDVYSVGPDGVDERGEGDDVVLGKDLAQVSSSSW